MNETDPALIEALRALGADGPQGASTQVEDRLIGAFRKRSRARIQRRWLSAGAATVAAGLALFAWMRPAPSKAGLPGSGTISSNGMKAAAPASRAVLPADETLQNVEAALDFVPLPDTDALPPLETAMIVRVEMPVSSLRLMGVLVSGAQPGGEIQADLLLGQDGLARGVRFVN